MFEDDWLYGNRTNWVVERWIEKVRQEEYQVARNYGYYEYNTRSGDVAKAALEALEKGVSLDTLLEKNSTVRLWWGHHVKERLAEHTRVEKEKERRAKAAEKKRIEDEKRQNAASKLTDEELAAFGLRKDGYQKR